MSELYFDVKAAALPGRSAGLYFDINAAADPPKKRRMQSPLPIDPPSSSHPLAGEAIDATKKRTSQFWLDKMKGLMAIGKGLCFALRQLNGTHRALTIRWNFGTFPIPYRFLRRVGLQWLLDHVKYLSRRKLDPHEQIYIRIALDKISRIPEVPPFVYQIY